MAKSKFFCVAVEGATTDGRKIERSWITDAAANFNPSTYGVRVNMEHIRGLSADGPFKSYGDVTALETRDVDVTLDGKIEKRLGLFAQIQPTDELVTINRAKQKLYSSIELSPDFAGTGKAGLVGLAVTDSPASIGTDVLEFAASKPELKLFAARKQAETNLIVEAREFALDLEPEGSAEGPLAGALKTLFSALGLGSQPAQPAAPAAQTPALAAAPSGAQGGQPDSAAFARLTESLQAFGAKTAESAELAAAATAKVAADLAALKTQLGSTEDHSQSRRPPAPGGSGAVLTDC